jgi:ABC-type amino acid transport substrate-binding protein
MFISLRSALRVASLAAGFAAAMLATASAGTLDKVRDGKSIRLAVREDAPPYSFKGPTGEPTGFMVDLCRKVANDLATQLNVGQLAIAYVPVTAENRFHAIVSGQADLLCEPTSETLSRRALVDFSLPTFIDGASLLVKGDAINSIAALAGKKVGVLGGTTTEKSLREAIKNANLTMDIVAMKTHADGMSALQSGAIAGYFADRAILMYLASTAKDAQDLRLANDYLSLERYALAMARGSDDFRLAVDRALSNIYRSGDIGVVFAGTFGPQAQPSDLLKTLYVISALPQ